ETLLKNADIAMYRAKAAGGGYEFFGIEASQAVEQRHLLENELQQAVRGNEFDLFYQPQVRVDDRQICGAEALIRWRHPVDGWRTASRFMPFAEEIGMFRRLDEWVLRRALSQCGEVSLPPDFVVALNLSSREFETEDLADMLGQVLQAGRNAVPVLELEITENALVRPSPANEAAIRMLRSLDIVVSLDDFGTGYSSLSYLKTLPVGALKIDRTFVQDLPENPESQSIVRAILSLGQSLSYRVVAEGVETQAQHDILKEFGCQIAQGNFYAEPEAPEVFFARFC
ncbi:MAG: GGDEF domain-containing phosphodiesterase, partial [Rhodospirillales bacterium]